MKTIQKKIQEMLKENTGTHMLDSGMDNNRHWQQNQDVDFSKVPRYTIEMYTRDELVYTRSVYWFLTDCLKISEDSESFQKMFKSKYRKSEDCDLADMESFGDYLKDNLGATGLYGDGEPFTVNTYNGECTLSQTLQFLYFEIGKKHLVILQIHGGCDVRGGYTRPYIFEVVDESFFMFSDGYIFFIGDDELHTDDGYHWYAMGCDAVTIKKVDGEPTVNPVRIMVDGEIKTIDYRRL